MQKDEDAAELSAHIAIRIRAFVLSFCGYGVNGSMRGFQPFGESSNLSIRSNTFAEVVIVDRLAMEC